MNGETPNLHAASVLLAQGAMKSQVLTESSLRAISCDQTNAVVTTVDSALEHAEASDRRRTNGRSLGPLDGIPIAVKDNIFIKGVRATCGSRMLAHHIAPYDATVVERLRAAGAIIVATCSMDEFGMGSSTETNHFGPCRNPYDLDRTPGGSSGGAAAAVASGLCLGSFGSDTGGSIRQPAAFCGLTGLKPTYGRVSRFGLVAYASSFDQIGPLAHSAADAALLLHAIEGLDRLDPTTVHRPAPEERPNLGANAKGLRVGVDPRLLLLDGIAPEVRNAFLRSLDVFRDLGAHIVDVALPHLPIAVAAYYVIAMAEASSNLARFDGLRYGVPALASGGVDDTIAKTRARGFGAEVKRRILLGTYVLSKGYRDATYERAQKARLLVAADFDRAFAKVDLIAMPTTPTPAFRLGEKIDDPVAMYLSDVYTVPANLASLCAISFPCGFTNAARPLPIGMQMLAPGFMEPLLLRGVSAFQRATDHHCKRPVLSTSPHATTGGGAR